MKVKALTGFSHGGFSPLEGDEIDVPDQIGKELQAAGLVAGGKGEDSREAREQRAKDEKKRRTEEAAEVEAKRQKDEFDTVQRRRDLLEGNRESNEKMAAPMENRMVTPAATKKAEDDGPPPANKKK